MKSFKNIFMVAFFICAASANAKQYYGSTFGMKSDGTTLNTGSLQKAIDFISTESPGDTLTLWVGRYLTGTVYLKSNVTIQLREGAVLVGINSAHDYFVSNGTTAILVADGQENITIYGKGVIEGNAPALLDEIGRQKEKGFLPKDYVQPALVSMSNCKNIKIEGIVLQNSCNESGIFGHCDNLTIQDLLIFGDVASKGGGITLNDNHGVAILNTYIQTQGVPLKASGNKDAKAENFKIPTGEKITFDN